MGAFGERLKSEREKRKITIDEVALATKISSRLLRALEEEKYDLLPGGIFNKGFVRSYARHLGLNEDQTVTDYMEAFRATHPEEPLAADPEAEGRKILEQRVLRVQQERRRMQNFPWGKAVVAVLLLAFAVALWGSYSRYKKPARAFTDAHASKRQKATSGLTPASQQSTTTTEVAGENSPTPSDVPATENTDDATPGAFHVTIRAHDNSWIHVKADGKDVLEDTLQADSQKSVGANKRLEIKAGNVGALDFWFNGRKLPAQGDLDQVKIVTFNANGVIIPAPKVLSVSDPTSHQ